MEPRKKEDAKGTQDAVTVTEILKACSFDKLCAELLEALLAGHAVAEIVWTVRDGLVVPKRVVKGYTLDRPGAEYAQNAPMVQKPLNKQAPQVVMREYVNPRTGEVAQVPVGIDPGFAYNPGMARQQALQQIVDGKLRSADPGLADAARRAGFTKD